MYKKKRSLASDEYVEQPGITYMPCKFCGSSDYDQSDGDVNDRNEYTPETCDICNYGNVKNSHILIQ